ncbi:ATP-dependent helicase HepA [Marinicauda pacifica]|uniref:Helicase SNF2 n=1 Tax=Marinicauda pacifica TaxID=1133559 RepID=A0A4S2HBI9_9PROT|nr:DEAD/DEAH box helicase [Marinicauda pacifica]TGY93133.1 helicase SNF2 [Marinicauda pacifica]GGE43141.1 ATP-dependent helicase HepA [Marinicauda pacifica]
MTVENFSAGEIVRARGREWVVVQAGETLRLRPMSGSEEDIEDIIPELELSTVSHASFPPPDFERRGGREAAQLLKDALTLSLRRGAGPFRGAGRLNFEPRAYQLAPLIMALRQETVRLLIADDVGVGKTIEAGLILREMIDRGQIERFAVLCPPHLVDQWVEELEDKFALKATPVTASHAARLERELVGAESVFEAHRFTVVSLDFIKSLRRIDDFSRACPEMVIVDEAHTAVSAGAAKHRRFELIKRLAEDEERHMALLTATPHSGDEAAFHALLGLLRPEFERIAEAGPDERRRLRERLANHFIQRRRADIADWREPGLFPERLSAEVPYQLTGENEKFFREIIEYCAEVIESEAGDRRQRLAFWGMLALMRCVGSSPAAALRALRNRALTDVEDGDVEAAAAAALDDEEFSEDDLEPSAGLNDPRLAGLISKAEGLTANFGRDPKFQSLVATLKRFTKEGCQPVVFCRYIATAKAVGEALKAEFPRVAIDVVTGELTSEDREKRVEALGSQRDKHILVATDCLSEGINLQRHFDSVIHYDLSWNPTRHQQREGRVDRFGQKAKTVRTVLLYGENNPIDGAVLEVIIRKARAIERETGVRVPLPDDGGSLTKALMSTVLLKAKESRQLQLDLFAQARSEAEAIEIAWRNASEQEKKSRTVFAQSTLKLGDVQPEWEATRQALGGFEDVERFVAGAMKRLAAPLQLKGENAFAASLSETPETLKERFFAEGLEIEKPIRIAFEARPPSGFASVHRAHPLPAVLAETMLEFSLEDPDGPDDPAVLPRCGAWESDGVENVTLLLLLRLRHRIEARGKLTAGFSLAEEAQALALDARDLSTVLSGDKAMSLLARESGNIPAQVAQRYFEMAPDVLGQIDLVLRAYAEERAQALSDAHTRFRRALGSEAEARVAPVPPVDVIGYYVIFPKV